MVAIPQPPCVFFIFSETVKPADFAEFVHEDHRGDEAETAHRLEGINHRRHRPGRHDLDQCRLEALYLLGRTSRGVEEWYDAPDGLRLAPPTSGHAGRPSSIYRDKSGRRSRIACLR